MFAPETCIVFLRIVVGLWFLKAVWTKLTIQLAWGVLPYIAVSPRFVGFQPKRVSEFAVGNPIGWYKDFLENVVLPHARLFAELQAYAEVIVGFALILGCCVGIASLLGLFLTINYGLATQWMSFGQQGFHVMLASAMIMFVAAHAGRAWGLDGFALKRRTLSRRKWLRIFMAFAAVVCLPLTAAAEVHVFVTNEKSNDVTVIRGSDNKVMQTIPVGKRPRGIAAAADGLRVYVANSDSNNVSVIDTRSLQVVDTLPAGVDPEGMAIDARGRLYAVNENDSALTIIDVATRQILQRLDVGTEPETAVVSPDGKWVAISNETSNDIYLYDTAAGILARKVEVPKNPRGMRFTADSRRLYVASEQAHVVSNIDIAKQQVLESGATGGQRPVDIIISADGARLYVSHGGSGEVRILDSTTLKPMTIIPTGPRSWWMARTPDKRFIYLTVGRANEVVVIDTMTDAVAARIPAGTLPWGVAVVALD